MTTQTQLTGPVRAVLDRHRIPEILKQSNRWVTWRAGDVKPTGKFDKVPINPRTGRNISANDPANWFGFDEACAAYDAGLCSGIGIALSDQPIVFSDGAPLFLTALDYDHCASKIVEIKQDRNALGKAYAEISPSGLGLRMFALSTEPIKGGNAGHGREIYGSGRFMTVTGNAGRGEVVEATKVLQELVSRWFPTETKPKNLKNVTNTLAFPPRPENPMHVELIKSQLKCVSADCSYEDWTRIVWSVLSSGWKCAVSLAEEWSRSAPNQYDQTVFDTVVASFDSNRGITLGTLHHYATKAGWESAKPADQRVRPIVEIGSTKATQGTPLLTASDLVILPALQWRVKGLLPAKGMASIYGPSGSGKTFLALDVACAIAAGRPQWFGSKVKGAPVAYVALEGTAGLQQRVKAWVLHHKKTAPNAIRFVLGGFTLLAPHHATALATEIVGTLGRGAVVVIDTLNQSAPGADENSSVDMGTVISNAKVLADAVDGLVILVHHSGKDQTRGMRGHSSLHAALDSVIEVVNGPSGRSWRVTKSKDGESGVAHGFELVPYVVGQDEDSEDITSCAVRSALTGTNAKRSGPTGKNQIAALQVMSGLASTRGGGISLADAIQAVAAAFQGPAGRRNSRAKEAIESLTETGHLQLADGQISIP